MMMFGNLILLIIAIAYAVVSTIYIMSIGNDEDDENDGDRVVSHPYQ